MRYLTGLFLLLVHCAQPGVAQEQFVYDNKVYLPQIKTVQCYNTQKEQSLPVIVLSSEEQILLSFDDLQGGSREYWYTIEHCTSDWLPSRLSTIDYLESFQDDRIIDYRYSFNTLQKFTNYQVLVPNDQIRPKIAGNYLIKVYLEGNLQKPVLSQRIYVTNNTVNVGAEITASSQVARRFQNQKVNFTVFHQSPIQNPHSDLKAVIMQNANPKTAILNTKPTFIRPGSLVYNDLNTNDFPAGNEFRKFDIRSLRYKAEHVDQILRDTAINVVLFQDLPANNNKYTNVIDENGNFFIRNQEGRDDDTDSDYANVLFTLKALPPSAEGDTYVVGRFNNYTLNSSNRLSYDPARKEYYTNIKLKQGLYDYKYVWLDKTTGKIDQTAFEGSFFEAENTYQIFIYYRKPGSRWEELVGYTSLNSERK